MIQIRQNNPVWIIKNKYRILKRNTMPLLIQFILFFVPFENNFCHTLSIAKCYTFIKR